MKILLRNNIHGHWKLVESVAYGQESVLQHLLADTPSLISIEEVREGASELKVAVREFPLTIGSVDLLAFSAEGDIAIIECKLASNTEVKRKVIGQVLEYAANLWEMDFDELDEKIKERTSENLLDLMKKAIDIPDWDPEEFRRSVEERLKDGNFILMIVVDEINEELSRIVRYFNACGQPAFSFAALEMRRFQSDETEMLIPKVFGTVRKDTSTSSKTDRKKWDEPRFFKAINENRPKEIIDLTTDLYEWSKQHATEVHFGTGSASGSYSFYLNRDGVTGSIFSVYTTGNIAINFGYMAKIFSPDEVNQFRQKVKTIPSMSGAKDGEQFYFSIGLDKAFSKPEYLAQFKEHVLSLKELIH